MKNKLCCLSCILITSFSILPDAYGQVVLIGNYPSTDTSGSSVDASPGNWKAVSFHTANDGISYDIANVVLRLSNGSTPTAADPSVGFFTDSSSQPGTLIGSLLTDPGPIATASTPTDYTFLPSGTLTLSPDTTYWLVVGAAAGSFQFRGTATAMSSEAGATPGVFLRSQNGGSTWLSSSIANSFKVNATAVPEPVHYTLGGAVALLAFAGYRRYQASSNRPSA